MRANIRLENAKDYVIYLNDEEIRNRTSNTTDTSIKQNPRSNETQHHTDGITTLSSFASLTLPGNTHVVSVPHSVLEIGRSVLVFLGACYVGHRTLVVISVLAPRWAS